LEWGSFNRSEVHGKVMLGSNVDGVMEERAIETM
jgi:hypothetical protein